MKIKNVQGLVRLCQSQNGSDWLLVVCFPGVSMGFPEEGIALLPQDLRGADIMYFGGKTDNAKWISSTAEDDLDPNRIRDAFMKLFPLDPRDGVTEYVHCSVSGELELHGIQDPKQMTKADLEFPPIEHSRLVVVGLRLAMFGW